MENLRKQTILWKPHNSNSTWAFSKVKSNQPINFEHNQTMHYIICHIEMVGWGIMVFRTSCHKTFIAYHKSNGIITKKKHIEANDKALYKKYAKEANAISWITKSPFVWKLTTKSHIWTHVPLQGFFPFINTLKNKHIKLFGKTWSCYL